MQHSSVARERFYFLDNLKAFIIVLMVLFHIAMGYTTWDLSWWTVNDIQKNKLFDLFVFETDVYIMPIMFMTAGYFAPMSLYKKGINAFWKNKCSRIVLPWLGGVLLIAPLIAYSSLYSRLAAPPNFFEFWHTGFWGPYYQQGHYWFLGILALFFGILTVFHLIYPSYLTRQIASTTPPAYLLPVFLLLTAISFFSANLFFWCDTWTNVQFIFMVQPVRLLLHFLYFSLGVYAWKHGWFQQSGYRPHLLGWSTAAATMLAIFLLYRVTFTLAPTMSALMKAGHAFVHSAFALTATMALLAIFQTCCNSSAYLWRRLSANSYTIYFIHQCVVIPIGCIVQTADVNIWLKYSGVSIVTLVVCFVLAEYIVRPFLASLKQRPSPLQRPG